MSNNQIGCDPVKIALLVVDMQCFILQNHPVAQACKTINRTAQTLRANGHVVIHIQDMAEADTVKEELLGFIPEIEVKNEDLVVQKNFFNAFWKTELEQLLHDHQVGLVVVAGYDAGNCVLFTYNGAIERGFQTAILQHGILSSREDLVTLTYRDRNIVSYPVLANIRRVGQ
ncbi:cysteine hydrolase family protein [Paenibacillus aurantiacus]|uniref:Cysteine hydrolase family protein n=1 Tax=Paenibacillus aurantiacus TaxID=1936118 RepID=A0ABV5KHH4_9BACL